MTEEEILKIATAHFNQKTRTYFFVVGTILETKANEVRLANHLRLNGFEVKIETNCLWISEKSIYEDV